MMNSFVQNDPFFRRGEFRNNNNAMTPEQIEFEKEFSKWDQGFQEWRTTYASHPDRSAFFTYEKKFLDVRDRLVERRAELKMKYQRSRDRNLNSSFNNDLCQASAAAESILAQFEDDGPGPSFGRDRGFPSNSNFGSSSSFGSSSNFGINSNFGMMGRPRPLPPVNPLLNYTHKKGQQPNMNSMHNMNNMNNMMNRGPNMMNRGPNMMMNRPQGPSTGMQRMMKMNQMQQQRPNPMNQQANKPKPNPVSVQQQQQQQLQQHHNELASVKISNEQYEQAKQQDLPNKLTGSQVKRFKFIRTKEDNKHTAEEKTFIERYMFISRKRNQYLYDQREKKRLQAGLSDQPAAPGDYDMTDEDFTSDDAPMTGVFPQ